MMQVKEIIIVEGVHDSQKLKTYVDCDTLETGGTKLTKERLALIALLQKKRGVIIFTDPDVPGERIRSWINEAVPGCKNAFIEKRKARTKRKVGVEHACGADIIESLRHVITYQEKQPETLRWEVFMRMGFSGGKDSRHRREILGNALFVGACNAKTLWKRLNMLGISDAEFMQLCKQYFS